MTKHRLQFDFDQAALEELDELQVAANLPTRAELIRQALRLFQWIFTETAHGAKILIERDEKVREIVFPFWTISSSSHAERDTS